MYQKNNWGKTTLAVLGLAAFSTALACAQTKEDVVKDRQAAMKSFGADNKAIGEYVKGAGDKAAAAKAAQQIAATATKLAGMYPAGTSSADMPGVSLAKPAAFTDGDKFTGRFATLASDANKLADTINTGTTDDVKAAQGAMAKNCGACHKEYREPLPKPAAAPPAAP